FHHTGPASRICDRRAPSVTWCGYALCCVQLQVATQLGHMPGGLHIILRQRNLPGFVDDERAANDALYHLAVPFLRAERAPRPQTIGVGGGWLGDRDITAVRGW